MRTKLSVRAENFQPQLARRIIRPLLAAGFSLAITFTLSCSGADGRDGTGCTVEPKPSGGGYNVLCGGEVVGTLSNGEKGADGAPGAAGVAGATGAKGDKGEAGADGATGPAGVAGADGAAGVAGPAGPAGADGANGTSCTVQSKTGGYNVICGGENVGELLNGVPGQQGVQGASGVSCSIGPYAANSAYYTITCGSASEQFAKAWCGTTAYDPSEQTCKNGILSIVFADSRDGKTYKAVTIGDQVWMSENLDYDVEGSKCYNDDEGNCAEYGRLYNWATAMALPDCGSGTSCGSDIGSNHQGVCPEGWHIPSDAEWTELTDFVGSNAGTKLKATGSWNSYGDIPAGTDKFGFAALPGGRGGSDVGNHGNWWSATEYGANDAYYRYMYFNIESVDKYLNYKNGLFSVRCLQD
jgi:uncharacterized protein (TIGR02145 family)